MASILRGFPESAGATVASTELNSLGSAPNGATGAEYDNSASGERWTEGLLELNVDFASAPTEGAAIEVYMLFAPDGTNYGNVNTAATPSELYPSRVGSFVVAATSAAQRLHLPVRLMPFKTKFHFVNRSGQAFPASGSTVTLYPFTTEVAAS